MLEPTLLTTVALFGTGILAGTCNAIAGGGTFFTFPAFLATGLPPVIANASNAVAVWPGHALAILDYRKELSDRRNLDSISILLAFWGAVAGAYLLLNTRNDLFLKLVPLLLLFATVTFAYGSSINIWLSKKFDSSTNRSNWFFRALEFLFATYGGFFGAGLGVMLMAGLSIVGIKDIHIANAIKNLLATIITSVAVLVLWMSDFISWQHTLPAFAGAIIGGLLGGKLARRIPAQLLRRIIIATGLTLSIFYFVNPDIA